MNTTTMNMRDGGNALGNTSASAADRSRQESVEFARKKLKTYRMKTSTPPRTPSQTLPLLPPPSTRVPILSTPPSSRNSKRHSRGPSLSLSLSSPPNVSPPLPSTGTPSPPHQRQSVGERVPRPISHHARRSSVSTRRESLELMGALGLPSSSSSPAHNPHSAGRDDALRALEGRSASLGPGLFVKGFEQVVVPDWKTPDVEPRSFEWLQGTKPAPPSSSAGFGSASLINKRDSFGKSLMAASSLKDQLHTLLEEEEEEEEEDVSKPAPALSPPVAPAPPRSPRSRPTTLRLASLPAPSSYLPAPCPTTIIPSPPSPKAAHSTRLRPLSLAPSLPSPALTPSPRLSSLSTEPGSPGVANSPLPTSASAPALNLRPLSLATSVAPLFPRTSLPGGGPPTPAPSISPSPSSASFSAVSANPGRRYSALSYRSNQSQSSSGGRASPAISNASIDRRESGLPPATPTHERSLALQVTYLQQENATLLARIATLEEALGKSASPVPLPDKVDIASLKARIEDLERTEKTLRARVENERKEAWAAKEVARRLGERVWEFERARDLSTSVASVAASASVGLPLTRPTLEHANSAATTHTMTSSSSPRSMISGRAGSGTSSFWGGSARGSSLESVTDEGEMEGGVHEGWAEGLDVVKEEEEEEEERIEVPQGKGIEVTLDPASRSESGSVRDSVSAYSVSSAEEGSEAENEAQSLAVLEGLAEGEEFVNDEEDEEKWQQGGDGEEEEEERKSEASLPNPFSEKGSVDEKVMPLPVTPTTPMPVTPVTPTPARTFWAQQQQQQQAAAPSPARYATLPPTRQFQPLQSAKPLQPVTLPPRQSGPLQPAKPQGPTSSRPPIPQPHGSHKSTPSKAAFSSWTFPRGPIPAPQKKQDEEKDPFFACLEEGETKGVVGVVGKQMGTGIGRGRSRRKKSVARPWMGEEDELEEEVLVQKIEAVPVKHTPPVLHIISPAVSAPAPAQATWSLRASPTPTPPASAYDPASTRSQIKPKPAAPPSPPASSGGFWSSKITSVFSSWVAPTPTPSTPPLVSAPALVVTPPPPPPAATRPPAYFAPPLATATSPAPTTTAPSPPPRRPCYVRKGSQPHPVPSSLEKIDFSGQGKGGGCKRCVGEVLEL